MNAKGETMDEQRLPGDFHPFQDPEEVFANGEQLVARCPVGWSENDGGFWVVAGRAPVFEVLTQPALFQVGGEERAVRIPSDPPGFNRPLMPPQDVNPPIHRDFRAIINPFLSPQAMARHEPAFRKMIGSLVERFASDGRCDAAEQFAKVFPAKLAFRELFSIRDDEETDRVLTWVTRIAYGRFREPPAIIRELQSNWNHWCDEFVERRRTERHDDVVDALLFGHVDDGRPLTHLEIVGAIQVLILGGFMTTSDATCNLLVALAEHPEIEPRLRAEPSLLSAFIEEVLRLEPPVAARFRRCTAGVELGAETIEAGQRLLVHLAAANRDPAEFDHPDELDLDRPSNRHFTFGAGVHRCVGSSMARLTLTIAIEELLRRVENIRFDGDGRASRLSVSGATWRLVDALPIRFDTRVR